jgi:hypothetical protein
MRRHHEAIETIDVPDIALSWAFHQIPRSARFSGRYEQMDMIGHEDIGVNAATDLLSVLLQPAQVRFAVLLGEETCLALVAALNQVQRYTDKGNP